MKALLDTHIFLWLVFGNPKLGRRTQRILNKADTELWLSPVSIWETLMLEHAQRVRLEPNPLRWVRDVLGTQSFHEAALNHEVALHTRSVTLKHQDPADRFLAATAAVYDLTLVTSDERLLDGAGYATLANE